LSVAGKTESSNIAALVTRLRGRDPEGFTLLLARYGRLFKWYFQGHGMTEMEAEDKAVELIEDIAIYRIDTYSGTGDGFRAWVHTLMIHEAVNWWRKHKPQEQLPDDLSAPVDSAASETELPQPLSDCLSRALALLRPGDRMIVEMRAVRGSPFAHIAEAVGLKEGTVRQRYRRARIALQSLMGEKPGAGDGPDRTEGER